MNYAVQYRKTSMPLSTFRQKYQDRKKYMAYCRECPRYNTLWSCPPLAFDVDGYLNRFTWVNVLCAKIILSSHVIAEADTPKKSRRWAGRYCCPLSSTWRRNCANWRNKYPGACPSPPAGAIFAMSAPARAVTPADSRTRCVTPWMLSASTSPPSPRICSISTSCGAGSGCRNISL